MTNDANKLSQEESVPIDQVLGRAMRGESNSRGQGPFFLTFHWPGSGRTRICPIPFPAPEAALLHLAKVLHDNPDAVTPGSWVTICIRLGNKRVQ